jgi:uncharacterized Fe-S cluster-containing MiaB family protein
VIATLDDKEVKDETVRVLEYILKQKDSEEMLAMYLNSVFLRPDVLEKLTKLFTDAACLTLDDVATKDKA